MGVKDHGCVQASFLLVQCNAMHIIERGNESGKVSRQGTAAALSEVFRHPTWLTAVAISNIPGVYSIG